MTKVCGLGSRHCDRLQGVWEQIVTSCQHMPKKSTTPSPLAQLPYSFFFFWSTHAHMHAHTHTCTHTSKPTTLSLKSSSSATLPGLIMPFPNRIDYMALQGQRSWLSTNVAWAKRRTIKWSDTRPDSAARSHCLPDLSTAINMPCPDCYSMVNPPHLPKGLLRRWTSGGGYCPTSFTAEWIWSYTHNGIVQTRLYCQNNRKGWDRWVFPIYYDYTKMAVGLLIGSLRRFSTGAEASLPSSKIWTWDKLSFLAFWQALPLASYPILERLCFWTS